MSDDATPEAETTGRGGAGVWVLGMAAVLIGLFVAYALTADIQPTQAELEREDRLAAQRAEAPGGVDLRIMQMKIEELGGPANAVIREARLTRAYGSDDIGDACGIVEMPARTALGQEDWVFAMVYAGDAVLFDPFFQWDTTVLQVPTLFPGLTGDAWNQQMERHDREMAVWEQARRMHYGVGACEDVGHRILVQDVAIPQLNWEDGRVAHEIRWPEGVPIPVVD